MLNFDNLIKIFLSKGEVTAAKILNKYPGSYEQFQKEIAFQKSKVLDDMKSTINNSEFGYNQNLQLKKITQNSEILHQIKKVIIIFIEKICSQIKAMEKIKYGENITKFEYMKKKYLIDKQNIQKKPYQQKEQSDQNVKINYQKDFQSKKNEFEKIQSQEEQMITGVYKKSSSFNDFKMFVRDNKKKGNNSIYKQYLKELKK